MNSLVVFLSQSASTSGASASAGASPSFGSMGIISTLLYFAVIIVVFYFILIRPQKKQQREHDALVSSVEIGDSIVTTSGFYGVVIDVADRIVVVEFGSNKNCRIPMQKQAIAEIEKADNGSAQPAKEEPKAEKNDKTDKNAKKKVKE